MTDNQIADIILVDLKLKSPRALLTDILVPRQLWDMSQEHRIKNIILLLTSKNLITSSGKYFPGTDMQLTITGYGIDILSRFDSYSSFLQSQITSDRGFSHNIIGDNFQGNTIFVGDNSNDKSDFSIGKSQTSIIEQPITPVIKNDKAKIFISILEKYWWALVVPTIVGLVILAIEYNWFLKK